MTVTQESGSDALLQEYKLSRMNIEECYKEFYTLLLCYWGA